MPNAKRAKTVVAEQSKRQSKLIDGAITSAALNLVCTSEEHAAALPHVIERWNTTADRIEREFGKGFFPIRLEHASAVSFRFIGLPGGLAPLGVFPPDDSLGSKSCALAQCRLSVLSVLKDDPVYGWMSDLLFMSQLPEQLILREAGGRNSAWHRRIRKTKESQFLKQAKALADETNDRIQDRGFDNVTGEPLDIEFWREVKRNRAEWEGVVRKDRSYSRTLPVPVTPAAPDGASEPPVPFKPRFERRVDSDPMAEAERARRERRRIAEEWQEIWYRPATK